MTDSRVKGRVKGLFGGSSDSEPIDAQIVPPPLPPGVPEPEAQRQALQVLVLAQRTAEEHVATARQQADKVRTDARAAAEQVGREAHAHAEGIRREAGKALADARGAAEQIARDAHGHAEGVRREAEKILADARAMADQIGKDALAKAEALDREAQQRYDDIVGSLAVKRDALQEQIEGLQRFDRDYRAQLRTFMHSQLQALGTEDPTPTAESRRPTVVSIGTTLEQD